MFYDCGMQVDEIKFGSRVNILVKGNHHSFEPELRYNVNVDIRPVKFFCYTSLQVGFYNVKKEFILIVKKNSVLLMMKLFKVVHHSRIHA